MTFTAAAARLAECAPSPYPSSRLSRSASQSRFPRPRMNARVRSLVGQSTVTVSRPSPGLYLVATPIGNLGDITLRALETLAGCDLIACEDSRVTRSCLTEKFLISTPLTPYHEHNAQAARPKLLQRLAQGASIALVSDAGTPLISDPGFKLVREAAAAGHAITPIPGPSAVLAALTVAGLPTDRFYFEGFLPPKQGARRTRIKRACRHRRDAGPVRGRLAHRRQRCAISPTTMGERDGAVCRELTKLHEDIRRAPLQALAAEAAAPRDARRVRDRHRPTARRRAAAEHRRRRRHSQSRDENPERQGRGRARRRIVRAAEARGVCPRARTCEADGTADEEG